MARITVEDCIDKFPSRFELVLVASQRARKLHSGDAPAIEKDNDKNTVIALREIADSAFTVTEMKENLIQEYQTVTLSDEEEENVEIESLDSIEQINFEKKETETETNIQAETDTNTNTSTSTLEIEEEMKDLISSEESEIEQQYEISDNLDSGENTLDSEEINQPLE